MIHRIIVSTLILCTTIFCYAQDKSTIQIKAFDKQLKPYPNLEISLNSKEFIAIGTKGVVFADVSESDLPPKNIKISSPDLEAESWNYSKGVLEIIVRKKSYKVLKLLVRTSDQKSLANVGITFNGKKNAQGVTNSDGILELTIPADEAVSSKDQFTASGFTVSAIKLSEKESILVLERQKAKEKGTSQKDPAVQQNELFENFDLTKLDSIKSLTVFYAVFKNYQIGDLSNPMKRKVDAKFRQLILQLEDSIRSSRTFVGRISDSSFVGEDVRNLLAQAKAEKNTLETLRENFDEKIQIISDKLSTGVSNLDAPTRDQLIKDINMLESVLKENEEKFYKNQSDYRSILLSLKEQFNEIGDLENRLSLSESQRAEERREFQRKMLTIIFVTICFAAITIMLIYFSNRLKKQQGELLKANGEIKRMNENLEVLVSERTALLENAHREMDIFLYKASHDLRGPICSIIGLCNIAARTTTDANSLELIQKTYHTAFAMDRMLKKLKVISEINHPSNYSLVLIDDQLRMIRQNYRNFVKDNNINFKIDCNRSITFHSYPNLVEVILTNLIENAMFYSTLKRGTNPEVEIKVEKKYQAVEITVSDNGIGIEEEIRDRVWDMFFIGNEESRGNGLGLYIVRKSVEVLNGNIFIQSRKGEFTRVVVIIPVVETLMVGPREPVPLIAGE
jgi:signal transduction histidine kinase